MSIDGKYGGSGTYSYRETSSGRNSVHVSHMPEERNSIRIVFRSHGETHLPILKIHENEAKLLWVSLVAMAEDLKWSGRMIGDSENK